MLSTFYVLRALADEWSRAATGNPVTGAYSQHPGELSIEIGGSAPVTLRARLTGPLRFVIADPRSARARRNVATVLNALTGQTITDVRVADRDRILYLDLSVGCLAITLFGGRANALLLDNDGSVVDRFRSVGDAVSPVPRSVAAPVQAVLIEHAETVVAERSEARKAHAEFAPFAASKLVRSLNPLMNKRLAAECTHRFGSDEVVDRAGLVRLVATVIDVDAEAMHAGHPSVYWDGERPVSVSVMQFQHLAHLRMESFETTTEAARVFVKRALAWSRYDEEANPVRSQAKRSRDKQAARLAAIRSELSRPSRADEYERFGHILMASPGVEIPPGKSGERVMITLADPFEEDKAATIAVDPAMTVVENGQRYYEKAKSARASREHAEQRVDAMEREFSDLQQTVDALESADDPDSWRALKKANPEIVAGVMSRRADVKPKIPFRRYTLGSGFEVWVGRNARQNDELTMRAARKFDLWLHARGVPGSHVLLRRPTRTGTVPEHYVEWAAKIAAYHSKARGSALVPVIVAERKHVRKPRGATPGTVLVDRQRVVIVEPGIPDDTVESR